MFEEEVFETARGTLTSKLKIIEEFYETAAKPFRERIADLRKYEAEEMEPFNGPSPHDEIQKNEDFLNLLGQSCLCLICTAVNDYLGDFALEKGKLLDLTRYKNVIRKTNQKPGESFAFTKSIRA